MASRDPGQSLPKFGDWDVNNPSSVDFSVVFNKARDEKKANVKTGNVASPVKNDKAYQQNQENGVPVKKKWFCCV